MFLGTRSYYPCQLTFYSLDDVAESVKNDISNPQYCEAVDMLRFLFSFCDTTGGVFEVVPKDKEFKFAFEEVRKLADMKKSSFMEHLDQA